MRFAILAFCIWFLLGCDLAQAKIFSPETLILPNGLHIVVLPNDRAPVVTQMLWLKSGSTDDPYKHSGIAHFLEHLLFKGTKTRKEGEYSKIISHLGGQENAMTSYDFTAYYVTIGKPHLKKVMALEADRFYHWQVTDDQVSRERQVILKERQQTVEDDPVSAFWEKVNWRLYDTMYDRPVIGWRREMETLNRSVAENYFKTHYRPENTILIYSGAVTLAEIKPLAEKYFGAEKPKVTNNPVPLPIKKVDLKPLNVVSELATENIWTAHWLADGAAKRKLAQSDALQVLAKIIGDSRTGLLYKKLVVQDKIATSASVTYDATARISTRWSVVVVPKPDIPFSRIEQEVLKIIKQTLKNGFTEKQVKDAIQSMRIDMLYARDSVVGPAMIVGNALVSGYRLEDIETTPDRLEKITSAQINQIAREIVQQKPLIATMKVAEKKK
jgi:zinc protease